MATANLELTTAEKRCLTAYNRHVERFGVPPTIRALAAVLEVYPNAVQRTLKRLEGKGYLARKEEKITRQRLVISPKGKKAIG